jgi:hypothetical protein
MDDSSLPDFTHFSTTQADLPPEHYVAIGRALYRWSQLEAAVCALATTIQGPSWLEAVRTLRGPHGFKVKNVFQQLKAAAHKRSGSSSSQVHNDLTRAESLYASRKMLFHSIWGYVSGPGRAQVGIQEWANDAYDNFRPVGLEELRAFAEDCAATSQSLLKSAIPLFHDGTTTIVVDDEDGLTKGSKPNIYPRDRRP